MKHVHFCWKRVLWGMNHCALSGPVFQPWRLLLDPKSIIFLSSSLQPLARLKITVTLHIEYFKSFGLFFIMLIGDIWNQFSFNELWCSSIFLEKQSYLSVSFRRKLLCNSLRMEVYIIKVCYKTTCCFPFFFPLASRKTQFTRVIGSTELHGENVIVFFEAAIWTKSWKWFSTVSDVPTGSSISGEYTSSVMITAAFTWAPSYWISSA